jgi:putative methyltransferase
MIMSYKTRLDSELARLKIRRKVHKNEDLIPDRIRNAVNLPRYVRINALKTNPEKVISDFIKAGYKKISPDEVPNYKGKFVAQDIHIKEILILPSSIDLHDNPLLLNGHIIIQDKASCFPAFVLSPPANSVCIDACAAPGNKTSHLSAILNNTGKIFAFDMDQRRLNTLIKLTGRAGCKSNIVRL